MPNFLDLVCIVLFVLGFKRIARGCNYLHDVCLHLGYLETLLSNHLGYLNLQMCVEQEIILYILEKLSLNTCNWKKNILFIQF